MAVVTKCDVIRDFAAAARCGLCGPGKPVNCPPGLSAALCSIPSAANNRMALFADRYNPLNVFLGAADSATLAQEERNYMSGIQASETGLAAAYPGAAPATLAVGWPDFGYCLWNRQGAPGGPFNNVHFERNDAQAFGMKPTYPLGGTFAQGAIWPPPAASPVPLAVDYVMNPDLAVILVFALLVVVFAVLLWKAYRDKRGAPRRTAQQKEAERQRLEADDPYRGTAFESYPDPLAKCREYVEAMEAAGYSMQYYRQQCGLPAQ